MTPEIVVTAIEILRTRPEAADLRQIHHYAAETGATIEEVSYIVKIYVETPPLYTNMGLELYVGDKKIRKYSQFRNGIYFKVNNPQQLTALQGQEVQFRQPGAEEFVDSGVSFPIEQISERRLMSAEEISLPSQEEVLRE